MSGGLAWAMRGAVDEGDHRVDDRLRVHDHVDAVVRDAEEQVGLDQLEPLVDQRGGVERDHRAHVPRRVGQRLGDGDVGQLGALSPAERAARGGEHQPVDLLGPAAAQALGQRGVLGVDRHDLPGRRGRRHQRAARDQGLLVGERERGPGGERGQRGAEADRPGDAVEHRVDGRGGGELGGRVGAREHLDARQQLTQGARRVLGGDRHAPDVVRANLLGEQRDVATARGQPGDGEALGVAGYQLQRLCADRAGGAEHEHRSITSHRLPSSSARCCATIRPWRATPVRWRSPLRSLPTTSRRPQWGWHGGFPKGTIIGGVVTIILLIAFIPGPYQSHDAGHLARPHRARHRSRGSSGT